MNKKSGIMVDFAKEFIEQQEKALTKAFKDPSMAELLAKSPETAELCVVSAMLKGLLLVQANIADRLFDIEKLLMKEV